MGKSKDAPMMLITGLTPESVRAIVSGVKEIVRLKMSDGAKLEAIRALGEASRSQPITVSGCTLWGGVAPRITRKLK